VADITVTPDPATVRVGETVTLQATPKDQSGNTLSGRPVTWTSVNAAIASVTAGGVVAGVSEGTTDVSAVAGGTVKTLSVTVSPARVSSVDVRPLLGQLAIGATLQMTATPRGSSGQPFAGRAVQWSSLNTAVATVSASGLVTAVAPGEATISATVEQQIGRADVVVIDPTAPRITSITPFPLVVGGTATVVGVNFGPTAGDNAVTVDGVPATVTAGNATGLTFTVPDTGCRPARLAQLRVTAGGKTGSFLHPVTPAAFTQVGVGEQLILGGSGPCLQFQSATDFQSYLVGVQSVAEDPANVIQTLLVTRTGLSPVGVASGPGAPALGSPRPAPARPAPPSDSAAARLLASHARRHLEARAAEATLLAAGMDFSAAANQSLRSAIPPGATVGQRFTVRVPPHYPGSCTQFTTVQAEVRLVTDRAHWLVDVAALGATYTNAQLQAIADEIEDDVLPVLEPVFGALPDTDSNPRLSVVITDRVNAEGWLSYPSLYDYLPVSQCAASNEGDFLYMATPNAVGGFPASLLVSVMGYSVAHDLTHTIQNRAVIAGGTRVPPWIEEGQAGMGEEMYAHRVTSRTPGQNYGAGVIFSTIGPVQPYAIVAALPYLYGYENDGAPKLAGAPELCTWLGPRDGATTTFGPCLMPGPSGGAWAFLRWLTDHYGGAIGGADILQRGLIDTPGTGFTRVETLVGVPMPTLLSRFSATLYADDRLVPIEPTLDFPSWNLAEMDAAGVPAARLVPRTRGFSEQSEAGSLRAASTLYYTFSSATRPATALEVTGPGGAALDAAARVWVVRIQ